MAWQGGFLDNSAMRFNPNLNVLIGGRGTGKSTVIESLRHALELEPIGAEARSGYDGIVKNVLRSGTKVSLLVRCQRPGPREYRIERTIPNPPVVRDAETSEVLNMSVSDIFPGVEIYGQHEISELARSPAKLTRLLGRFVERDDAIGNRKRELRQQLQASRKGILDVRNELDSVKERLARLPGLEETLRSYEEAGLEDDLKEQSLLVREEHVLDTVAERLQPFPSWLDKLRQETPIDRAFLSPTALDGLPGKIMLAKADQALAEFSTDVERVIADLHAALDKVDLAVEEVRSWFRTRQAEMQSVYERKLRELQKSQIDGEEFLRLRRRIEALRPLDERREKFHRLAADHKERRRNLLAEWEDVKAEEFRALERAAKRVTRKLQGRVRVRVEFARNRESLFRLLRDRVKGRLSETVSVLRQRETLSLNAFVSACRQGTDALATEFGVPAMQANRLAEASEETLMQIEELDLPSVTGIELNAASPDEAESWQDLNKLSTGQKATAILLLLLLESDAPLVVDQPEDDLDNRFITEGIVPRMREEKRRRQFLFATHNANIPVLGDAELIVGP